MSFNKSESEQSSQVFEQQVPFLQQLYQRAQNLSGQQIGGIGPAAQGLADEFLGELRGGLGTLRGIADGTAPGQAFLRDRMGAVNPHLDQMIDAIGGDIRRNLGREVGAGIGGEAAGVGGAYGGSRHGIREGMAHEAATREFTDAATQLRFGDYAAGDARAEALTGASQTAAARMAALAPSGYNLGISPYNAAWLPLQQLAAALGRPTVLSSGESSGFGLAL